MNKQKIFNKIVKDIKSIKIQGAKNIAKKAFYAYSLIPTNTSKQKLLSARPTEPMLVNMLNNSKVLSYYEVINHLDSSQEIINKETFRLIKDNSIIFTHCHSSAVVSALIYARKKGKRFEVYNTETRPLFQGRKTSKELKKARIKVTMIVDSAASVALSGEQGFKKPRLILLGADAILKKGVINKIGSEMFSQIAKSNKIPVYILANSWKYFPRNIKIEQRDLEEVWKTNRKIKIRNPAFEFIKKKYISGIISEFGLLSYNQFLRKVKKRKFI
ncbi:MAG: hypothetical protein WC438_01300 [Candidatus Pacearchaeota archaeon]